MKRKNKKAPRRPGMPRITEEMRQWSAMLEQEISTWPQVTSRPMFGMKGCHRRGKIFAALPVTRAIGTANAIIFKIDPMPADLLQRAHEDPRIDSNREHPDTRWRAFDIHSADDLRDALWWLNQAYELSKPGAVKKRAVKNLRRGG